MGATTFLKDPSIHWRFVPGTSLSVSDNTATIRALDLASGKPILEQKETHSPILSPGGEILLATTKTEFNIWSTSDWSRQRSLPRTPVYSIPLAMDRKTDVLQSRRREHLNFIV